MNTQHLTWRYATKQFDPSKRVSDSELSLILEAIRLAPTSFGLQPFRVVVVTNSPVRQQLREASWNQSQITDASHLFIFQTLTDVSEAVVDAYIQRIATTRSVDVSSLDGYRGMILGYLGHHPSPVAWAQRQAYLAMGFGLQTAAQLHIDTCPIEGLDPSAYDRILNLGGGYTTLVAVAVGYRSSDDQYQHAKKVRLPQEIFCVTVS